MEGKNLVIKMLFLTCILFAPITLLVDILISIIVSKSSLLSLGATFIILLVCFIISAFVITLKESSPKALTKARILYYSCSFYTFLSILLKFVVTIVNLSKKIVWNTTIFSIILIFTFSILISICILYLKINSIVLKITIYFFVIGIFYYLLTVTIGGLNVGNYLILILSTYVLGFALAFAVVLFIKSHKKNKENENTPYQKQF